jgi:hypothetical protein
MENAKSATLTTVLTAMEAWTLAVVATMATQSMRINAPNARSAIASAARRMEKLAIPVIAAMDWSRMSARVAVSAIAEFATVMLLLAQVATL